MPRLTKSCLLANAVRYAMQYRSFLVFTPQPINCEYEVKKRFFDTSEISTIGRSGLLCTGVSTFVLRGR